MINKKLNDKILKDMELERLAMMKEKPIGTETIVQED